MEKDFGEKEQHSEQHLYTWAWHEFLVIDLAASEHASYAHRKITTKLYLLVWSTPWGCEPRTLPLGRPPLVKWHSLSSATLDDFQVVYRELVGLIWRIPTWTPFPQILDRFFVAHRTQKTRASALVTSNVAFCGFYGISNRNQKLSESPNGDLFRGTFFASGREPRMEGWRMKTQKFLTQIVKCFLTWETTNSSFKTRSAALFAIEMADIHSVTGTSATTLGVSQDTVRWVGVFWLLPKAQQSLGPIWRPWHLERLMSASRVEGPQVDPKKLERRRSNSVAGRRWTMEESLNSS